MIRQKKRLIEKLREARTEKISQAVLAKRISSNQPAIARMESGQVGEVSMEKQHKGSRYEYFTYCGA